MTKWISPLRVLALLALLCGLLCTTAFADEGDYDKINSYIVTVALREDGSADITYDIDWQVLAGDRTEYLSWVKIGLANRHAEDLTPLTDTISKIDLMTDGGSYAKVVFARRYYAPDITAVNGGESRVQFAFSVHQSHLYTRNDDGSASFTFTPGWFEDLCVDQMTVRWKTGDGFVADNTGTEGEYLTWQFGPLEHGQAATVQVTVPASFAAGFDSSLAQTSADFTEESSGGDMAGVMTAFVILMVLLIFYLSYAKRAGRWNDGVAPDDADWVWYTNGVNTIHVARYLTPPAGYHPTTPPANFKAGGGSFRGGGAGRRSGGDFHGGCACACASSCACACACAGGGRAGCSVKDFYRVKIKQGR